jgi:predicted PurR-regulated permease PerM
MIRYAHMSVIKELKEIPEFRLLTIVLLIISGAYLFGMVWNILSRFSNIFLLVFLSWLLSFILEPIIAKLTSMSFSRAISAVIVYMGLVVFLLIAGFLIIPSILSQLTTLASVLPEYFSSLPSWLNQFQNVVVSAIGTSVNFISLALSFFFSLFIIIILSLYFSIDREHIGKEILSLIPKGYRDEALFLKDVVNYSFAQFFRVQTVFGIIAGIFTWIVMLILHIPFAATAAVLAGLFTIIPLIGPFLALVPPVLLGFLDLPSKGWASLILLVIFQQLEFNVFGPRLMGSAFKIHPIVVLLSFFVGYTVAGGWGSLFAVPIVSILVIIGKELWKHWIIESNYKDEEVGTGTARP